MPVSPITGITQEDQPQELSSFLRAGVSYVFWATPVIGLSRRIRWKPHNAADYTEVIPTLLQNYSSVSCLYDPASDHLVVVWDDGDALDGSRNGTLYTARFNPVTAALISGPTALFQGASARLCYMTATQDSKFLLYYKTAKNLGVYGRRSEDGGLTWQNAYPLITGQVTSTAALEVVPYDGVHVSIAQLGGARSLLEMGMFQRTRPLVSIVKHPTLPEKFYVGEPSKFNNVTLTDNLRGSLVLATDNSKLYHLDGLQQGTSDGLGAITLLGSTGTVLAPIPAGHVVDGNTRFLWRLDEAGGTDTVVDAVGTYNLPTANGVPVAEAGMIGNGRHFNNTTMRGPSDAATVSKFARTAGSWTFGFWIKIPSVDAGSTTRGVLTLCDNGAIGTAVFYLKTAFAGLYHGSSSNGNTFTGIDFTGLSGQWVHCVLTWDAVNNNRAWRNGILVGTYNVPPNPTSLTTPTWVLGQGQISPGQEEVLDDVWMDNTLWTTPQIQADYSAGTGSAGPATGANGDDIVSYTLGPSVDALNIDLPGTSYAVVLGVSATHGYVGEYADNSGTAGQFVVVDLTTGTTATVFSGVTGVRAVAVANFLSPALIFVASTESGIERLRVYSENALAPALQLNTKLTSRANAITAAVDPTNPTGALVYVSCVDRLNIYRYTSSSVPVQLVDSLTLAGGSNFFQVVLAANGNIVVAAGAAGVLVLNPEGRILAQTSVSGKIVLDWFPSRVYALNALVKPRASHQFARSRFYFRASTGGTSGAGEPLWAATGTVIDNTAQWQAVGLVDGVVTGLALDETNKKIYAVGVAGGVLGTDGRVWVLNAAGLI
jgi:hypothetical protein